MFLKSWHIAVLTSTDSSAYKGDMLPDKTYSLCDAVSFVLMRQHGELFAAAQLHRYTVLASSLTPIGVKNYSQLISTPVKP